MPRRSCLANLIIAKLLITGVADQGELVDVVNLDFFKAFVLVCHRLLIKEIAAMGINLKINCWVEEFLKNRTLRVKLGGHLSSEGTVKSGEHQGSVLGPLLVLIFINNLTDELACNQFFADDVKLIARKKTAARAEVINPTSIHMVS